MLKRHIEAYEQHPGRRAACGSVPWLQRSCIRFSQPRPGNLNHDGRNQGQQKVGHLRMSRPDDLPETEQPRPKPTAVPSKEAIKETFRVFMSPSSIGGYGKNPSFVPSRFAILPPNRACCSSRSLKRDVYLTPEPILHKQAELLSAMLAGRSDPKNPILGDVARGSGSWRCSKHRCTRASEASSPGGACDELDPPGSSSLGDSPHTGAVAGNATALPRVTNSLVAGGGQHNPDRHTGGAR